MRRRSNRYPGLCDEKLATGGRRFRICITHNGETHQRYFYYGIKRTKADALKMAKAEWERLREKMPMLTAERKAEKLEKAGPNAKVTGVRRIIGISKGREYEFWSATWSDSKGRRCTRKFSITKYGVRKGRELAIEARVKGLMSSK